MSVTVTSKPTDYQPQHRTYTELAADAVFDNRAVCDECFARIRLNNGRRAFRGTVGYDVEEKDAYGAIESYERRTTCADCGSIGCSPLDETLSVQQAVDRVASLAARLQEAGHEPNVGAMYCVIREAKRRDGLHGRDDDLFKAAAKFGLRKGRVNR